MRRFAFILAAFVLMMAPHRPADAAEFGTRYRYQHLQDLAAKGPKGEALALGYETATHSFILPYTMTGRYVLLVKGSGRDMFAGKDIYHDLSPEKITEMQRAGTLPNPLPRARHTFFDYAFAYVLWWCIPVGLLFIWIFSALGLGSRRSNAARPV
jgi:hypothetical protein